MADLAGLPLKYHRLEFRVYAARSIHRRGPRKRGTSNEDCPLLGGNLKMRVFHPAPRLDASTRNDFLSQGALGHERGFNLESAGEPTRWPKVWRPKECLHS